MGEKSILFDKTKTQKLNAQGAFSIQIEKERKKQRKNKKKRT